MTESFLTAPGSSKAQRDPRTMRGAAFPLQPSPLHGLTLPACADRIPTAMKARPQPAAARTKTGKIASQDLDERARVSPAAVSPPSTPGPPVSARARAQAPP